VIRRVQAVIHVKREEDETEEDAVALPASSSSGSGSAVVVRKRKKEDHVAVETQPLNRQRRCSRKTAAIFSDEDVGDSNEQDVSLEDNGETAGGGGGVYKLRKPPKVDYREEPEEEEDELMMGAEVPCILILFHAAKDLTYSRRIIMMKCMARTLLTRQDSKRSQLYHPRRDAGFPPGEFSYRLIFLLHYLQPSLISVFLYTHGKRLCMLGAGCIKIPTK